MPDVNGKRLVSETMVRPKHRARVVVTLEVQISNDGLNTMPGWERHAVKYLRNALSHYETPQDEEISVLGMSVEVAG